MGNIFIRYIDNLDNIYIVYTMLYTIYSPIVPLQGTYIYMTNISLYCSVSKWVLLSSIPNPEQTTDVVNITIYFSYLIPQCNNIYTCLIYGVTLLIVQCTTYSVRRTMYGVHCTAYNLRCTFIHCEFVDLPRCYRINLRGIYELTPIRKASTNSCSIYRIKVYLQNASLFIEIANAYTMRVTKYTRRIIAKRKTIQCQFQKTR